LGKNHLKKAEQPDHLVTRACIAAFIGFVTVPILPIRCGCFCISTERISHREHATATPWRGWAMGSPSACFWFGFCCEYRGNWSILLLGRTA
jgi:hypothetical protein